MDYKFKEFAKYKKKKVRTKINNINRKTRESKLPGAREMLG